MPEYRNGDRWPDDQPGAESATPMMVCPCGSFCQEKDHAGYYCETCGAEFDDKGNRVIDVENDVDEDGELIPTDYAAHEHDPARDVLAELAHIMGLSASSLTAVRHEVNALVQVRQASGVRVPLSETPPPLRAVSERTD